jgi:hypothetical protein
LLHSLPTIPGAREISVTSVSYSETNGPELLRRTAGYTTTAAINTPRAITARAVVTFYRQHLHGWRCGVTESDPRSDIIVLECARGREMVNVNTDNLGSSRHFYELTVDAAGVKDA